MARHHRRCHPAAFPNSIRFRQVADLSCPVTAARRHSFRLSFAEGVTAIVCWSTIPFARLQMTEAVKWQQQQ